MLLLLCSLLQPAVEPATNRGSNSASPRKPQRTKYEVDRFSDFERKPTAIRSDDDELMLIYMMQGG